VDLWASWIIQFSNHGTYCCSPGYRNWNSIVFLTNKYQQEYVAHGNKALATACIQKSELLDDKLLTTAAGLLLLSLPIARLLKEFGIISSLSIVALFFFMSYYYSHLLQLSTFRKKAPETFEPQLKRSWLGLKNGKNTIDIHVYLVIYFLF
jgi:hypothetical protein